MAPEGGRLRDTSRGSLVLAWETQHVRPARQGVARRGKAKHDKACDVGLGLAMKEECVLELISHCFLLD